MDATGDQGAPPDLKTRSPSEIQLTLTPRWEGFSEPLLLTHAPGDSSRLFIVEKTGRIRVVVNRRLLAEPFLDLSSAINAEGEGGLLGLAFSPDYMNTGRFYVNFTDKAGDTRVERYTAADPASSKPKIVRRERVLFVNQTVYNHYGGCIVFGPDRYLYVGTGDSAALGASRSNAQNPKSVLGKILRLDVGEAADSPAVPATYRIPSDNPFAGTTGYRPEIWALGLRNPWRFSFDRSTSDLWIGDVGQSGWEEIDRMEGGVGGRNFGWSVYEGTHPYPSGSRAPTDASRYTMPVAEYEHPTGKCVIGGYVYRGSAYPALRGIYVYADWVSGRMWGLRSEGETETAEFERTSLNISSFGEDAEGELYVCDLQSGTVFGISASAR